MGALSVLLITHVAGVAIALIRRRLKASTPRADVRQGPEVAPTREDLVKALELLSSHVANSHVAGDKADRNGGCGSPGFPSISHALERARESRSENGVALAVAKFDKKLVSPRPSFPRRTNTTQTAAPTVGTKVENVGEAALSGLSGFGL